MANPTIYTASRVRHAQKWLDARANGFNVISTWIDEAGEGQTSSMAGLWLRCVYEAKTADALILYREGDDPLKGALIETGAALSAGVRVFAVGFNDGEDLKTFSFLHHPLVTLCETLETAFVMAHGMEVPHG